MNSIDEEIIELSKDKSYLSSPYRSVFVINSSCFFKVKDIQRIVIADVTV